MKNDWATALSDARMKKIEDVPKGWLTIKQIANDVMGGVGVTHARVQINELIKMKKVERRKFRIAQDSGSTRLVYHYRLK